MILIFQNIYSNSLIINLADELYGVFKELVMIKFMSTIFIINFKVSIFGIIAYVSSQYLIISTLSTPINCK